MSKLPKITIVTPSYNQGAFLRETIESVLNQNYPSLEYFIVDGGSTDNSVEIIREYEDRVDWWVSEKDKGQSDAIYKGFQKASGDLLGWLNSDDVYFPQALIKIGQAYAMNPNASIYSGGTAIGKKSNGGIKKCSIPTGQLKIFNSCGIFGSGQQSSFFNARTYHKIGGISRHLHMRMDGDLVFRLLRQNPSAVVINDMVGFFRWHERSKSSSLIDKYKGERNEFLESLKVPMRQLKMRTALFKAYRLISGGYFKSFLATHRYHGMRMDKIWKDAGYAPGEKCP